MGPRADGSRVCALAVILLDLDTFYQGLEIIARRNRRAAYC